MGNFWGADVQALRKLGTELKNKAGEVQTIQSQLTSLVSSTDWKGPDADKFRNEWNSTHVPNLKRLNSDLQQAGTRATANAQAQETTSQQG